MNATLRLPPLVRDTICVALVWKEFSKSTTGAKAAGAIATVGSTVRSSCGRQDEAVKKLRRRSRTGRASSQGFGGCQTQLASDMTMDGPVRVVCVGFRL